MLLNLYRALTPETVLYQLKYRYDMEVNNCKRLVSNKYIVLQLIVAIAASP